MDFKQWWGEQEIFGGEGSMDAAEAAWDYWEERFNKLVKAVNEEARLNICSAEDYMAMSRTESDYNDGKEYVAEEMLDILKDFK